MDVLRVVLKVSRLLGIVIDCIINRFKQLKILIIHFGMVKSDVSEPIGLSLVQIFQNENTVVIVFAYRFYWIPLLQ